MKRTAIRSATLVLAALLILGVFTACSSSTSEPAAGSTVLGAAGTPLAVDGNKHFVSSSPIVYHQWNNVFTFNGVPSYASISATAPSSLGLQTVGSFEEDQFATGLPPQTGGSIGTYTYDTATLTLTWTTLYTYNATTLVWDPLPATVTSISHTKRYYCANAFDSIYEKGTTAGTWVSTYWGSDTDSANPTSDSTYTWTDTITMPVGGATGTGTFSQVYDLWNTVNAGTPTESTSFPQTKVTGTCTLYPKDVTFTNGNAVTALVTTTTSLETKSFYMYGKYLIWYPSNASRSVMAGER